MNIVGNLWVDKYRPKKLSELVLPDSYREDFEICIKNKEIGNLLLYGPPGSGKTAIGQIIASKNGIIKNQDNLLFINGSAKESRGIGYIDSVVEPYCKYPPSGDDKYKIVFIDEIDNSTPDNIKSLRGITEKYSKYVRFIFTCNYVSKIPDFLHSRTQSYEFKQMPIEFVINYCKNILEKEEIKFEEKDLKYIVESLYPDIRKIVNCLQKNSLTKTLRIGKDSVLTNEKIAMGLFIEMIQFVVNNEDHKINNNLNKLTQILGELDLDYRSIYNDLFYRKEVPTTVKILINKYANSHNDCLVPSIHFFSLVYETIKALQQYRKLVSGK